MIKSGIGLASMEAEINPRRAHWINYIACLWGLAFAAPHVWWALGVPFGFPGGPANHRLLMTTWRYFFDLFVILLSLTAATLAIALARPDGRAIPRRVLRTSAWIACGMLSLRGVAGLVHDRLSDPVWNPTFVVGGILFGCVAWLSRPESTRQGAAPDSRLDP